MIESVPTNDCYSGPRGALWALMGSKLELASVTYLMGARHAKYKRIVYGRKLSGKLIWNRYITEGRDVGGVPCALLHHGPILWNL